MKRNTFFTVTLAIMLAAAVLYYVRGNTDAAIAYAGC